MTEHMHEANEIAPNRFVPALIAGVAASIVTANAAFADRNSEASSSGSREYHNPITLNDRRTNMTFFVEGDRRHVSALTADGKIVWTKNPFEDAKLSPYRFKHPLIVSMSIAPAWKVGPKTEIEILFDSSQFGLIDEYTGEFQYEGQN